MLDEVIKRMYMDRNNFIKDKNNELEREYFSLKGLMPGSYNDNFDYFKHVVMNANEGEVNRVYELLESYFLFSHGHDMIFKKKLEVDIFASDLIDEVIYPLVEEGVHRKYNDISVMKENPNYEKNIKGIDRLVYIYTELQSLLYLLYCNDFQFPNNIRDFYSDTYEDIITILNESGMNIGDFLNGLVDYKCNIMRDIFMNISNLNLRSDMLRRVEELRRRKHEEIKGFGHVSLPVTYFLNHSMFDFLQIKRKKALFSDDKEVKRILVP